MLNLFKNGFFKLPEKDTTTIWFKPQTIKLVFAAKLVTIRSKNKDFLALKQDNGSV